MRRVTFGDINLLAGHLKFVFLLGSTFCEGVPLGMALLATWVPQEGQILRGGCPREGTCFDRVPLGRALFVTWVPQ